jgi:myo-inositol-1(or 4)-monophosphatase
MPMTDADVGIAASRAGAEVVRRGFGGDHVRTAKSATDFATETDVDAERAIMSVLSAHRPRDARTGEESGTSGAASSSRRWLVDPLCGTLNFAAGTPLAVVNVALVDGDRVRAAAAADPFADEVFWTDGEHAHRRHDGEDRPLVPVPDSGLVDVNCDGPSDRPNIGGLLVGDPMFRAAFGPRVISSTLAVAWVAAGRRAAYVSDGDLRGSVHFAAGIALCEAAGCVVTDLAGDPLHTGRGLVVSADTRTHVRLLDLVDPHLRAVDRDG